MSAAVFDRLVQLNRMQDVWMTDGINAYLFPKGWLEEFPDPDAPFGEEPSAYGYHPVGDQPDSAIDTGWIPMSIVNELVFASEASAKQIHPRLFRALKQINAGDGRDFPELG